MENEGMVRYGWLKAMYIWTVLGAGGFGLAVLFLPEMTRAGMGYPAQDPLLFGIVACVFVAFGLLAVLGYRSPVRFAPVLLLQPGLQVDLVHRGPAAGRDRGVRAQLRLGPCRDLRDLHRRRPHRDPVPAPLREGDDGDRPEAGDGHASLISTTGCTRCGRGGGAPGRQRPAATSPVRLEAGPAGVRISRDFSEKYCYWNYL